MSETTGVRVVDLGVPGIRHAQAVFESTNLQTLCRSAPSWDRGRAISFLPNDIELEPRLLDSIEWGLWDELPRKAAQHEIDACARALERRLVRVELGEPGRAAIFDDPFARYTAPARREVGPEIQPLPGSRNFVVLEDQISAESIGSLIDFCCSCYTGGGVIGTMSSGDAIVSASEIEPRIMDPIAFVCEVFDGEAAMLWTILGDSD